MIIYELTHLFYQHAGEFVNSPKNLGLYYSYENIRHAIHYYTTLPGFCDCPEAFSIRERIVHGDVVDGIVFEAIVYLHSEDYEFENSIELGLYGDERIAQNKVIRFCEENRSLTSIPKLIIEKIVNKCFVEKREWSEGFSICE